jgi:coenzyme F420-0:L-glutamate ligase/coenzyme F420-1:gamma-L-glutamate ligase
MCHDASMTSNASDPAPPPGVSVYPVAGLGDVRPGDDLAELIARAAPWLADGDVLVVTSKIVSKAEGNLVPVPAEEGADRDAARAAALAAETARVVATRGPTYIVATRHGYVMAAAGIDASNVGPDHLVLLPKDPDASARALRSAMRDRHGLDVAVIISDTMGRPWRNGLTDVALGVAGLDAIRDYRGERDPYGNELQVTQMSPADELAGAAELVKGKHDQVPVAVVRGLRAAGTPDGEGAAVLVRSADMDMFSLGTAEARAAGLRLATRLDDADVLADAWPAPSIESIAGSPTTPGTDVANAIASAARMCPDVAWSVTVHHPESEDDDGDASVATVSAALPAGLDVGTTARGGAAIHVLRAYLASCGYRTQWLAPDPTVSAALDTIALGTVLVRPR